MSESELAELMADYDRTAAEYCASLPLEHFMESTPQATQRAIFLVAFDYIRWRRPDIHPFSELLIQYEFGIPPRRRYVVPDNMVVVHDGAVEPIRSYPLSLMPAGPFLVLEYVSHESSDKDYGDVFRKYEQELHVPYYLIFDPEPGTMSLFALGRTSYHPVEPDFSGRVSIPELDVEAGLIDGWVRFWFRGELLPRGVDIPDILDAKDLEITERDEVIAQQEEVIAEREEIIAQRDEVIAEREEIIAQRDEVIAEREEIIAQRDEVIAERQEIITQQQQVIAEREQVIAQQQAAIAEREQQLAERERAMAELQRRLEEALRAQNGEK